MISFLNLQKEILWCECERPDKHRSGNNKSRGEKLSKNIISLKFQNLRVFQATWSIVITIWYPRWLVEKKMLVARARDTVHTEIIPRTMLDLKLNFNLMFAVEIERIEIRINKKIFNKKFSVLLVKSIVICNNLVCKFEVLNRTSNCENLSCKLMMSKLKYDRWNILINTWSQYYDTGRDKPMILLYLLEWRWQWPKKWWWRWS